MLRLKICVVAKHFSTEFWFEFIFNMCVEAAKYICLQQPFTSILILRTRYA